MMGQGNANPSRTVVGFFHAGVTVADLERSLEFYVSALGLEAVTDRVATDQYLRDIFGLTFSEVRVAFLAIPGSTAFIELLEYRGLAQQVVRFSPTQPGIGHFCLFVEDIEKLATHLQESGYRSLSPRPVEVTAGPNMGARVIYFEDPDGHSVELLQRAEGVQSRE